MRTLNLNMTNLTLNVVNITLCNIRPTVSGFAKNRLVS